MEEKKALLDQDERVVEIELERLRGFVNHPFKVQADSQMIELQESIKKYGILNPLIVRPRQDGTYEIISGHRRKFAAEKIGYRTRGQNGKSYSGIGGRPPISHAIHYHVRSEGRIVKRAVYIALGIDMNGKKDVLGMYVGENESAKFWLSIMNGLKNRGVEDILIACVDGLNGFPQAIEAVYPKTEIQQCIIHQIRNSTKFVSYKDIKKLMADLKLVYAAPTEETALNELELFKDKWDSKYPKIYKSWHDNWATLSTYFKYPEAVRRLIYTTNAIEGFNRQLRKVTKSKTVFPSDDSLLKMLYLATMDITKKWTGHRQDWGQIHSQLEIYFEERLIGRNL